ncbi:MerR family transcriptional regulator [Clostridium sp. AWRP]|uniref:MerR family transcriptional regulator n=1 Tax=Clostridium sp. AWRP TaxID=2212991 RepID=UPI000FDCA615|nr:MerR family transcriptional regulator [Clostridium sp. AWRP]AZV56524.1 MerR family transcriptional regulator [Clostridium sp. AWRP]
MEYTVHELADIAGVSARTLRYYDEIGILKPAKINSSGYRIYGQNEVDRLQLILFYREFGIKLENIREIITSPDFDRVKALREHRKKLLEKRMELDLLISNVENTIKSMEGRIVMSDTEKFEGFKKKLIDDNERKYGEEIRKKYGDEIVDKTNSNLKNMTPEEYEEVAGLENEILETLSKAYKTGNPAGELAQRAASLHAKWISLYWGNYNKEAHAGLAKMYVEDERFKAYYDKKQPGTAEFLRDAVLVYTGMKK